MWKIPAVTWRRSRSTSAINSASSLQRSGSVPTMESISARHPRAASKNRRRSGFPRLAFPSAMSFGTDHAARLSCAPATQVSRAGSAAAMRYTTLTSWVAALHVLSWRCEFTPYNAALGAQRSNHTHAPSSSPFQHCPSCPCCPCCPCVNHCLDSTYNHNDRLRWQGDLGILIRPPRGSKTAPFFRAADSVRNDRHT